MVIERRSASVSRLRGARADPLLALPTGTPRPARKATLDHRFEMFVLPKSPFFDAEFTEQMRRKHPTWFLRMRMTTRARWAELLALPAGTPRPLRSTPLGRALYILRHSRSKVACEAFITVSTKHPQWFNWGPSRDGGEPVRRR
jgi:hypothetical protein